MPHVETRGLRIEYETFGRPSDPPIVLIMGFGLQLIAWDERFCKRLVERGFFVVRFDNRDVGLSSKLDDGPPVDLAAVFGGDKSAAPYSVEDMSGDVVGLMDGLKLPAAHVVGVSMGGMIAQTLAIRHPSRVLSLTSIMSTTGDRSVGAATPEALQVLLAPSPPDRDAVIERGVALWRVISSPAFPLDEAQIRDRAGRAFDRCFHPVGVARQLAAVVTQNDRTADLAKVTVPTLVIHGRADPLITPSGGEATARAVPGATLLMIDGMGHDLPLDEWPRIIEAIVGNTRRATGAKSA